MKVLCVEGIVSQCFCGFCEIMTNPQLAISIVDIQIFVEKIFAESIFARHILQFIQQWAKIKA